MKINIIKSILLALSFFTVTSCLNDLNVTPKDDDVYLTENYMMQDNSYKELLAKAYGGLILPGNDGDGSGDIQGLRSDFTSYLRNYFTVQELPTDEAVIAWADGNLPTMNQHTWTANNEFIYGMFSRAAYQIAFHNEYLKQTTEEKVNSRGQSALWNDIKVYRAEVRYLRALSFWHMMDLFGNIPFATENDTFGSNQFPPQKDRAFVFDYLIKELNDIESILPAPKTNEYGRADKAAVWMLKAKLYQNASVYINQNKNTEAITELNKIINSGVYSLSEDYKNLFRADNNTNGAQNEVIFPIIHDGKNIRANGGVTYIMHASIGGKMNASDYGLNGGWYGLRAKRQLVEKFTDNDMNIIDPRGSFYTNDQSLDVTTIGNFNHGYAVTKYTNKKSKKVLNDANNPSAGYYFTDGDSGQDTEFGDTDFPMFRLADVYLMYAESVLRGGSGGDINTALTYIKALRTRAKASTSLTASDITLSFILDERARELHWECHRRTDLIRYGLFTGGSYIWQWKGGSKDGTSIDSKYNLYPIPNLAISGNPTLIQNSGY